MNQYSLIKGRNDIKTLFPEIAMQWDYDKNCDIKPDEVQPGSTKKIWWKCEKGHSWNAAVYSRKAGSGCPYCAGNRLVPGVNDLKTVMPDLAKEWDYDKNYPLMPIDVAANASKKVSWICKNGHIWDATVGSRTAGKGCPYCAGRKVCVGFNDLAHMNPNLAKEWDYEKNNGLTPEDVTQKSHKKVWWKDVFGHSWASSIANRSSGTGCVYCAGRKVLVGFNDVKSKCPNLIKEWDYDKNINLPEEITYGSQKKIWWKCKNNHSWQATVSDRRSGNGCPVCLNRKIIHGINDFKTIHPELIEEWDYELNSSIMPEQISFRSNKKVWWHCKDGHKWKTSIYARHRGNGCPSCAVKIDKHTVNKGVNDLASYNPNLALEWDNERNGNLTPDKITPYSNRKVWWKCSNGHHWQCAVQIREEGTGCPFCLGKVHRGSRII